MVVWGGDSNLYLPTQSFFNSGGRYDPVADRWTPTSITGAPAARTQHAAVWTGTEMIVWGGSPTVGGRYDPSTDTWRPVATPALSPSQAL